MKTLLSAIYLTILTSVKKNPFITYLRNEVNEFDNNNNCDIAFGKNEIKFNEYSFFF